MILKINEKKFELEQIFLKNSFSTLDVKIDFDLENIMCDEDIKTVINFNKNEKTHL